MPSPFPGMDPWLESEEVFPDLHERLLIYISEVLNVAMPPGYIATTKNRVWIDDTQRREPDVSVFGRGRPMGNEGGLAVATLPGLLALGAWPPPEPREEPYLEILSPKGRRLVTAIEVLSASNKTAGGRGRRAYLDKYEEYYLGGVNVVEIDLLRAGVHTTAVPKSRIEAAAGPFQYHIAVTLAGERATYFGAAIRMADRLPAIGIPLDAGAAPITVDLQGLLDKAYETGRYASLADYARPCDPALTPEQQAWAEGVLKSKGVV